MVLLRNGVPFSVPVTRICLRPPSAVVTWGGMSATAPPPLAASIVDRNLCVGFTIITG